MKKTIFPLVTALVVVVFSIEALADKKTSKTASHTNVPPGKPEVFALEPRGIQSGSTNRIKLIGTNLLDLTELKLQNPKLSGELLHELETATNVAWIELRVPSDMTPGPYELSVRNTNAESGKIKLFIDDLPQAYETAAASSRKDKPLLTLPVSYWGTLDPPGDADEVEFKATKGDSLVFDLAATSIGSKANAMLALLDDHGSVLAANNGFDGGDPLLHFRVPASGKYLLRISERTDAGSQDHFYRVSIGAFPMVIGHFPLGVMANKESEVQLIGYKPLPSSSVHIKAAAGEVELPLDPKFRSRRQFKILVNANSEIIEREPNDTTSNATPISVGSAIDGRIEPKPGQTADVDIYQFEAGSNQTIVIETDAARRGSPLDTKIEVVHADGKPVERVLLQAVRDSHITFRGIDSITDDLRVENWQEMELNELMYLQGEVCKIFRMPQGPDSGFQFYNVGGKRRTYFDTSPFTHSLDEPIYIVESHPPGSVLVPTGLPVFSVYYANDDDADRKLGTDSRLLFTAPQTGTYFVRVTDARGKGGERFVYRLMLREAKPDFKVTVSGTNPSVSAGAGASFTVRADRIDGFDRDIRVQIRELPSGFSITSPIVIQAGHLEAKGTINAALTAPMPELAPSTASKMTATALINGRNVTHEMESLGKITLAPQPKLFVSLEPYDQDTTNFVERLISDPPLEITIGPGQTIPCWLKIKRNGHDELVTFTVENLPHGVIVDNIGLNGVLIPKGQGARQIFLTAAKWVPEVDRLCFAQAKEAGTPCSLPVMVHVRKTGRHLSRSNP